MKLLVDHNLSPYLARSINLLFPDHEIIALCDKFPPDISDIDWMTALDNEGGWAVLTRDLRLRTRPHERAALDRSRIVYFFIGGGAWKRYTVPETAARLIRLVPLMDAQTRIAERGRFELPIKGSKLRPHRD